MKNLSLIIVVLLLTVTISAIQPIIKPIGKTESNNLRISQATKIKSKKKSRLNMRANPNLAFPSINIVDVDLTSQANNPSRMPNPSPVLNPKIKAAIELKLDYGNNDSTFEERYSTREAPWGDDVKTADANQMNDSYLSLATNPLSGNLYCVFESPDLGGTDRDLHIARSTDGGETWITYDMPSFTEDEYSPELAIDDSGYLHVTWIRADGVVLRTRSAVPDAPDNWLWIKGLITDETMQTPSIAVSGGGSFSTVMIASNWLTVNWDLYQYEWTIIWMWSTNGGETIQYDYFIPDGYPDYWSDIEIDGAHACMVNGEQDYYSGEVEIILSQDAVNGGFTDLIYLTQWTNNNCQFPQIARDGDNVYTVFQHNWDDGLGNIDGDIIYCYSWDAGESVYGPYELIADDYESVGPTIYTKDGVVGCLWLDAEPNDDQFYIAAIEAGGYGYPDNFGNIHYVSDQDNAEPQFHNVSGTISSEGMHAAWIDRRDFPTEGLNVYSSKREVLPDLSPFTPEGWDDCLLANMEEGVRQTGYLSANDDTYVSFAFINDGLTDITEDFNIQLLIDDEQVAEWILEGVLPAGSYVEITDFAVLVSAGQHDLAWQVDHNSVIIESDETDNIYSLDLYWIDGYPELRIDPAVISHEFENPTRLINNPPLMEHEHFPKISNRLNEVIERDDSNTYPIVFKPVRCLDLKTLNSNLRDASVIDRRRIVTGAARKISSDNIKELYPLFVSLGFEASEMWLSGMFSAKLTSVQITQLAADPRIGWIWLDDHHSEAFASTSWQHDRSIEWHLNDVGAPSAWDMGFDGNGMVVGLLDSGVAYDHPDLTNHMWDGGIEFPNHGWDAVDDDNDPYDGDTESYHGTHTAGLIVGDGTSGNSTGVAPGATLMALRAIPGTYTDLIEALQFGLDNGVWIFSFSAGWSQASDGLREAVRETAEFLGSSEYPWICAAGNGDNYGGHYPVPTDIALPGDCPNPWYGDAGHSGVITVSASTQSHDTWANCSYGPTEWNISGTDYNDYPYPDGLMKPDVSAPGYQITSTTPGGYITYDGTSMAAPIVAGTVAILFQADPTLSVAELAEILESTATDIGSPGRDNYSGAGIVNIPEALSNLPIGESEQFYLYNDGTLPLIIDNITENSSWLNITPDAEVILPGDSLLSHAWFDPTGLSAGYYSEEVEYFSNDPASPSTLLVEMGIGIEIIYGCTDPEAINYNPDATVDDGSCEYDLDTPINIQITVTTNEAEQAVCTIIWDAVENATYYNVYACDTPYGEFTIINEEPITETIYESICPSNSKFFQVTAN